MRIFQAITPEQIAAIRSLFEEYAASLNIDLCFQGFDDELATLPGLYAPPRGRLFLASSTGGFAGCAALRPIDSVVCEMKRLYVRSPYRDRGLGRELAQRLITAARSIGYSAMRLDTLPSMPAAIRLYELLGFVRRPAYYNTPVRGTVFMELLL